MQTYSSTAHRFDLNLVKKAYQRMLLIRRFEELTLELCKLGELQGVVHPYIGHEAVAVGACLTLKERDYVASYYRSHGHAIARGVDVGLMMAEMFGKAEGLCQGRGGSMHLSDLGKNFLGGNAIVGANVPIAVGLAISSQVRRTHAVTLVFFGDGATGSGIVHESLNIASAQRLPIVFICENNLYQDLTRSDVVFPSTDLVRIGQGHAMPSMTVDGNDLEAVWNATLDAVERARQGDGPSFIEAKTYLLKFHSQIGVSEPVEYMSQKEKAWWSDKDPLKLLQAHLEHKAVSSWWLGMIRDEVDQAITSAIQFAKQAPFPDPASIVSGVYA